MPKPSDPSQNEPTIGDATGDYVPEPSADDATAPGDQTSEFRESQPGDATSAFIVAPPQDGQTIDQPAETDIRAGERTGAASAGAFVLQAPQKRTGRYVLKKFHAKGGMGEVWLAEDSDIGREVALKRMRGGRDEHKDRFLLEAQVTGQLEHPCVIPIHEVGMDESGQPYYVMKFVRGETLTKAIEQYHSPSSEGGAGGVETPPKEVQRLRLLNIFINLCQAIAYAHSRGVIHRDIKPDNVMVGAYGETLVLDWGLAKVVGRPESDDFGPAVRLRTSGETMETLAGSVKGTPSYISPEVASGKVEEVDEISDVYLLGGTLYHLLTGRKPRGGAKLQEILEAARTKPPTPPRELDPTIDRPLNAICMKAMAFRKKDRYATAAALAEDLQRYLAGEPVLAYRETFFERAARWMRKHKKALGRAAVGVVVGSILLGAFLIIRDVQQQAAMNKEVADKLAREDRARQDRDRFRELGEEMRYLAANANPASGGGSFFDLDKAEEKGKSALAVTQAWGPKLELFPLGEEERATLKEEVYDLLLWMAHIGTRHTSPEKADDTLKLLDQAKEMQTPTRSYHRLRAQALERKGSTAEIDRQLAENEKTPVTALDHFLAGESIRGEAQRAMVGKTAKDETRKAKLLGAAEEKYREALRLDANYFWANYQRGLVLLGLDKPSESVEAFTACVALRPKSFYGWSSRATALARDKRYADAHRDLQDAEKLSPRSPLVRFFRAQLLVQEKKTHEAITVLDEILKSNEDLPGEIAFFRGTLRFDQGQIAEALPDFNRALADKNPVRTAHLYKARALLVEGKVEPALESLDKFIAAGEAIDLKNPLTYERRATELRLQSKEGWVKDKRGLLMLALAQTEKAIALGGKSASLYEELGAIYDRLGRFPQAIEAFTMALQVEPKNIEILMKRGWKCDSLNPPDWKKGLDDFKLAVEIDPERGEARAGLGYYQACLQDAENARKNANLATLYGAGDYGVIHNIACIYATLSHTDKARAKEYEDMAIDQLRRGVQLWRKGPPDQPLNALAMIRGEGAFPPSLRDRPEFRKLLEDEAK